MEGTPSAGRPGPGAGVFDVAVVGGGVVGCAVLRELSRYRLRLVLLEKAADVGEGVTKANSGVIHAGFNVPTGSLKAKANVAGLRAIYRMAEALGVPHRKTGKLVVALDAADVPRLEELMAQGRRNGCPDLEIIDAAAIRAFEPGASGVRALLSPHTGIISPYELTIALAESASLNGAAVLLESGVTAVVPRGGAFALATPKGEIAARWVVNCAGLSAGDVAALAGFPAPRVRPFRGEYLIIDREAAGTLRRPIYPVPPRDDSFLGVHVTPTMEGNVLLGPSSEAVGDADDSATTAAVAERLKAEAFGLVPGLARFPVIHAYAGVRPKLDDFVVEESPERPRWVNLFGIESPGLTAAPALAEIVAGIIGSREDLAPRPDFEPGLPAYVRFAHADDAERALRAEADHAAGEMVCRCEHATRAEVLAALRSPLGPRTFDAVKRRTRCGMGRCQGGFCTPRVTDILRREGLEPGEMTKRGGGSWMYAGWVKRSPQPPFSKGGNALGPRTFLNDEGKTLDSHIPLDDARSAQGPRASLDNGENASGPCPAFDNWGNASSPYTPPDNYGNVRGPCDPLSSAGNTVDPHAARLEEGKINGLGSRLYGDAKTDPPLRQRGGGGDLPALRSVAGPTAEDRDVVVIGGGPAGLAAAIGARRAGARDVLVLERDRALGGILNQCVHDGFGLFLYKETISGPEYAERLAEDAAREGVAFRTGAMVLDLSADKRLRVSSPEGYGVVEAGAVVLAMGCRERTRDMIGIPGTRPAGVFTAGTAQNLVNLRNLRVGNEAVILGSGDVGLIMARRLIFEGIRVRGVFEIMPWPGGLERNVRQCLLDFGVPLELGTTVVEVRGRDRLSSVVVARVGADLKPLAGTEREIACDTLLLSVGLIPENELSKRAGVSLSPLTGGAEVDETLMTSVPGIFSCGNVLHIHDVADWASFEGLRAGEAAALYAAGRRPSGGRVRVMAGEGVRYVVPQFVRAGAGPFELAFRAKAPGRDRWIEVRGAGSGKSLFRQRFPHLVPTELKKVSVAGPAGEDMEVSCHG